MDTDTKQLTPEEQDNQNVRVLRRFCGDIPWCAEPFVQDGFLHATNGAIAVRVKTNLPEPLASKNDMDSRAELVNFEFWNQFDAGGWEPLPQQALYRMTYESCPEGCSEPFPSPSEPGAMLSFDCETCEGTAYVHRGDLKIGFEWFALPFLLLLHEHFENPVYRGVANFGKPLMLIKDDNGNQAVLMAVNPNPAGKTVGDSHETNSPQGG